ncbi:MAG: hypothetical protein MI748_09550 [Opitutales bacterium]|nr:hypothetical protein [Opitutales bacterium]
MKIEPTVEWKILVKSTLEHSLEGGFLGGFILLRSDEGSLQPRMTAC